MVKWIEEHYPWLMTAVIPAIFGWLGRQQLNGWLSNLPDRLKDLKLTYTDIRHTQRKLQEVQYQLEQTQKEMRFEIQQKDLARANSEYLATALDGFIRRGEALMDLTTNPVIPSTKDIRSLLPEQPNSSKTSPIS